MVFERYSKIIVFYLLIVMLKVQSLHPETLIVGGFEEEREVQTTFEDIIVLSP